jgi:hypothetical protein
MKHTLTINFTEFESDQDGEPQLIPTTCQVTLEGDKSLIERINRALEVL